MAKTSLNKWYNKVNEGEMYETYTRDTWSIPDDGTEVWCTAWKRGQTIKPCGDGCHVVVGCATYHCNQFMEMLERLEKEGHKWGIDGVEMQREQQINGVWVKVKV